MNKLTFKVVGLKMLIIKISIVSFLKKKLLNEFFLINLYYICTFLIFLTIFDYFFINYFTNIYYLRVKRSPLFSHRLGGSQASRNHSRSPLLKYIQLLIIYRNKFLLSRYI